MTTEEIKNDIAKREAAVAETRLNAQKSESYGMQAQAEWLRERLANQISALEGARRALLQ